MTERRLRGLVFCSGTVLLGLEVLAVRVLSPYFGSSSFTVSSVLTVILLGLAIGYRVGGRLAARSDALKSYARLLVLAGAGVLLVAVSQRWLLPRVGYRLPADWGPLVTSVVLFALPSFALGAQSPITVRIHAEVAHDASALAPAASGQAAAAIFFWSTLGNILGGIVTGFLLIPRFSVSTILAAMGALLVGLGGLVLLTERRRGEAGASAGLALLLMAVGGREAHPHDLVDIDGEYQRIRIHDGILNGRPARFLIQDRSVSGAAYRDSDAVASDYTKVHELHAVSGGRRVLVLGGGAYEVPRAILAREPDAQLDVVEIEPALARLAQEYFGLPRSPRLKHHVGDGRRFLEETTARYDHIFVDAYSSLYAAPWHMATVEFFELAAQRLLPGGLVTANMIGDVQHLSLRSALGAMLHTFQAVFPQARFFPVLGVDHAGPQNVVAVSQRFLAPQPPPWLSHDFRPELRQCVVLCDDFAPLEHLVAMSLFH